MGDVVVGQLVRLSLKQPLMLILTMFAKLLDLLNKSMVCVHIQGNAQSKFSDKIDFSILKIYER